MIVFMFILFVSFENCSLISRPFVNTQHQKSCYFIMIHLEKINSTNFFLLSIKNCRKKCLNYISKMYGERTKK